MSKKEKKGKWGKFFLGALVGAGVGLLFAPKKGSETRKELKENIDDLIDKVKQIDIEEVKVSVEAKIGEIKDNLADLDKEKVLKIAKKKAKDIQALAEELVDYVVVKGTPVLEQGATIVKEQTIKVTKEILKNLEEEK